MCTGVRFTSSQGEMYWGRNLDWNESYGQVPMVMPKGFMLPRAFGKAEPAAHAALGMSVEYDGYPLFFNCGNDAGLAVGGLNFPGYAQYEDGPIDGKTNIAAYEFPAWVAATFGSVDEVRRALPNVAIINHAITPKLGVAMLHWMISDAKSSIVVEYKADGMHVYEDEVDVLTNQPPFDWHMENLRNYMCCNGSWPGEITWRNYKMQPFGTGATMRGIPGDTYSTSRFVKAAFINSFHPEKSDEAENVMRMFHTLGNVSFVEGCAAMADGSFEKTLFSDCFSAKTGNYYFNTYENPAIRYASLHDYDGISPEKIIAAEIHTS